MKCSDFTEWAKYASNKALTYITCNTTLNNNEAHGSNSGVLDVSTNLTCC